MEFSDEELQQIFKIFKDEAEEHLGIINKCLLDLEKKPDDADLVSELFREAHTIKGSARMLDVVSIQNLAHKMEDLLGLAKEGGATVTPEFIDLLCQGVDIITQILGKLEYNTLDYVDENSDKLALQIENFKQNIVSETNNVQEETTISEKSETENIIINESDTEQIELSNISDNNFNKDNDENKNTFFVKQENSNILKDTNSSFGIISHYISQLDSKYQKNNAISEVLTVINDSLTQNLSDLQNEILKLISDNLLYIKNNDILPSSEIVTAIKQALSSVYEPNENEDLNLVIQRLNILKQMLELSKDNEKLLLVPKKTNIQDINTKETEKNTRDNTVNTKYDTNLFKTLRVDTQKLDKLENYVEELIVLKIKNKQQLKNLNSLLNDLSEIQKNLWKFPINSKSNDKKIFPQQILSDKIVSSKNLQNQLDKITEKTDELYQSLDDFQKSFLNDDIRLNFLTEEIENMVKSIRILPLATVFHMFPRMVRDIARTQGKQVDIIITGSEASADKTIVEEIKAPLIHIIRNAVDHGIEDPQERIEKGKNPTGKILLNSYHSGNAITIEVVDDGRGLDIEKIKEKALRQNLLSNEELNQLSELQIMNLIFWPGFSTEDK
ncbi:MAG: Hpt domain-containing protein, partial [Candidatus Gastranaerophilales bacterium]|nr:Hpt domain-containing protein [Candidatus Gastranaerophilales bacterium]